MKDTKEKATKKIAPKPHKAKKPVQPVVTLCYIGPTIPNRLNKNCFLTGTKAQIKGTIKEVLTKYPEVKKLLVPAERLARAKRKLSEGHNAVTMAYGEMLQGTKMKEEK